MAEAFLSPLQTAGFADRQAGLAFFLLLDYTIGFAVSSPRTSVNEQRVRDQAIRSQLHRFNRFLPPDLFPALVALGEHVWVDNRDERFAAGLQVLVAGLEHARNAPTPTGAQATANHHHDHPRASTRTADNRRRHTREGNPMSIGARCGSCARELLLGQLVQSSDGFRCPFCGYAFAPAYATVAPVVAARVMAAQAALVTHPRRAWVDDWRPAAA